MKKPNIDNGHAPPALEGEPKQFHEALEAQRGEILKQVNSVVTDHSMAMKRYQSATNRVFIALLFFFLVIFCTVFTPLGDFIGFKTGWVIPTAPASGTDANSTAVVAATRNLISVLGPMIIGLALWILATVGLNRFREFDANLDRIRSSLEGTLEVFRVEIRERDAEARRDIKADISEGIGRVVKDAVDGETSRLDAYFDSLRENLKQTTDEVNSVRDAIEDRFGHIASNADYSKSDSNFGSVASVGAVNKHVEKLFRNGKRNQAVLLVREMLDSFQRTNGSNRPAGSLKGDWFNLSAELGRRDEERLALEVCLAALEQQNGAPIYDEDGNETWQDEAIRPDDDVLAHAIKYALTVNDSRILKLLQLSKLDETNLIGPAYWGWRSYAFSIQALEVIGRSEDAIQLGQNYLSSVVVTEDTGKVVEDIMSVMSRNGQLGDAAKLGQSWLSENPNAPAGQVVSTLLGWLDPLDDLENYLDLIDRGLRDHAEEQQSANLGMLFYRRAIAQDRHLLNAGNDEAQIPSVCDLIEATISDYRMAIKLELPDGLVPQANRRIEVIQYRAQVHGCSLTETPADEGESSHSDSSDSEGEAKIKSAISQILAALASAQGSEDDQLEAVQMILAGHSAPEKAFIVRFLNQMSSDEDLPDEFRLSLVSLLPKLI